MIIWVSLLNCSQYYNPLHCWPIAHVDDYCHWATHPPVIWHKATQTSACSCFGASFDYYANHWQTASWVSTRPMIHHLLCQSHISSICIQWTLCYVIRAAVRIIMVISLQPLLLYVFFIIYSMLMTIGSVLLLMILLYSVPVVMLHNQFWLFQCHSLVHVSTF